MWIFYRKYLFMSVVENMNDQTHSTLLVRFRRKANAVTFLTDFPVGVLKTTPDHDYKYRLMVPKEVMAEIIHKLVQNIDYGNFKDEAENRSKDSEESVLLHRVWDLLYEHQYGEPQD